MNKSKTWLACLLALALGSCASDEGQARVHRITYPAGEVTEMENLPQGFEQKVRKSYGSSFILPPRLEPHYFCDEQREGVEKLPQNLREEYRRFCKQSTYPHLIEEWVNRPGLSLKGKRKIIVSRTDQRGIFFIDDVPVVDFPVCTGTDGRLTPLGKFTILQKDPYHHSNLYHNAPMHCFMRMTWGGVGMHIGPIEGVRASHGCIRMPEKSAHLVYDRVSLGTLIEVLP